MLVAPGVWRINMTPGNPMESSSTSRHQLNCPYPTLLTTNRMLHMKRVVPKLQSLISPLLSSSPHVPLVPPLVRQPLHVRLCLAFAAGLLLCHQRYQRPVHVPRHVLGVAAHVQAAATAVDVPPHLACSIYTCTLLVALVIQPRKAVERQTHIHWPPGNTVASTDGPSLTCFCLHAAVRSC